ncbi:MAG: arylsulfatase [Verrucomicrobia bacterium]|nr:arylsulfatase [Verrucomicrobiota bacterium]
MNRRARFAVLLAGLLAPLLSAAAASRPNVVVLLADDAGWGDYGRNGNTMVRTPNIDSIATGGVVLDRFFVCSVCAPTRAEFLTGRYHPRGGVRGVSTGQERLDLGERTIAEAFKAAGYATAAFGKWHNGSQWPYHPRARGFDEYLGHTSGHWGEYFDAPLEDSHGRMVRTKGYIVDVCTERALDFIDRHPKDPFFLYVPFTTPHSPWAVPEEYWRRFKDRPLAQTATLPDQEDPNQTRCALAMIENQDWNVGRILQKLQQHRLTENTIVFFFSDNGPNSWRWNGGMKGRKGSTDEGGIRSPGFLRWPARLPAGHVVKEIAGAIDLLPTLTSLAGIPRVGDKPLDGRDLSPLLLKSGTAWPERWIFSAWNQNVSVRTQTHRLDAQGQLYDMVADPGQKSPINTREPALAARLASAVEAWRQDVFSGAGPTPRAKGKAKGEAKADGRRAGGAVDPRPIPVGYREFPITMLPARDGEPRGGVRRSSNAPNSSYFVNWTSREDSMVWLLDVHTAGRYAVSIDYTCRVPDAGSTIELSFQDRRVTGKVAPGWDPPLYTNQDTLPRPAGESQMKEFRTLSIGEVELPRGLGPLTLRAIEIPGQSVMDVRRVTLTLLP